MLKRYLLITLAILIHTSLLSQDLNNGLIACYSFSGNANDGSGNNNNGTVNGAQLTSDRFGNPNSAYSFNGSSDYISIPASPLANANYSYSVWIYLPSLPGDGEVGNIISVGDNTSKHQTLNVANDYGNAGYYGLVAGGYNNGTPPTTSVQLGSIPATMQWYHMVSVRTDSQMSFYVNGGLIGSSSTFGFSPYYGNTILANIGARCNLIQFFNGKIDDVTLYNRPLTAIEVQILYLQGLACEPPIPTPKVNSISFCGKGIATLIASGGTNYRWYDAETGGNLLFEGNPFTTPELSNTINYYVTNIENSKESKRVKVTVTIFPQPNLSCIVPSETFLGIDTYISTSIISGTNPFSYTFIFGDGSEITSSQSDVTYKFEMEGELTTAIKVTDMNHCESTCSEEILIKKPTPIPTVNSDSICGNGKLTLFASGGTVYRWYDSDGHFLFEGNPYVTHELSSTMDYYVSNFDNNMESERVKVTALVFPRPILSCSIPTDPLVDNPIVIITSVTSGTPTYQYYFDFDDNANQNISQHDSIVEFKNTGNYQIKTTVIDAHNCEASCSETIEVFDIFIPNIITVNNDSLNQRLSVFIKKNERYEVYAGNVKFKMEIFNRWGREVYETTNSVTGWTAENVSPGVYYYLIILGKKNYKGSISVLDSN